MIMIPNDLMTFSQTLSYPHPIHLFMPSPFVQRPLYIVSLSPLPSLCIVHSSTPFHLSASHFHRHTHATLNKQHINPYYIPHYIGYLLQWQMMLPLCFALRCLLLQQMNDRARQCFYLRGLVLTRFNPSSERAMNAGGELGGGQCACFVLSTCMKWRVAGWSRALTPWRWGVGHCYSASPSWFFLLPPCIYRVPSPARPAHRKGWTSMDQGAI